MSPSDADRLSALERAVLDLRRDVHDLHAALGVARTASQAPAPARPAEPPPVRVLRLPPEPRPAPGPGLLDRAAAYARLQAAGLGMHTAPNATSDAALDAAPRDLEAVVGRYGTIAVAALLILMAAGAFLTWAVANYDLSPAARVAMGTVAAAALAATGAWLRVRAAREAPHGEGPHGAGADGEGTRRFGDVLLAIALAVTHVDAWAAGPYLHLIPSAAALALAAAASVALAALAWRARQQALFLVGIGGALVAPFVTGSAAAHPLALRIYGWLVLATALLAIPTDVADHAADADTGADLTPDWSAAYLLLALGGATYTAAYFGGPLAMAAVGNPAGLALPGWMLERHAPVLFALACAALPLARAARRSAAPASRAAPRADGWLALSYLSAGAVALLTLAFNGDDATAWVLALALATTLMVYAVVAVLARTVRPTAPREPARDASLPDGLPPLGVAAGAGLPSTRVLLAAVAMAHPLLLLAAALGGLPRVTGWQGASVAALWGALAAGCAWAAWTAERRGGAHAAAPRGPLPGAHAAAAGLATALVPVFLPGPHNVVWAVLLAVHAALAMQVLRPLRHPLALLAPAVSGGAAAAWAWVLLDARLPYAYTPFLTRESVAGGAVVLAWAAIAWRVWQDGTRVFPSGERRAIVGLAAAVALGWGREELAHAFAPDVATVLLVAYFAAAGIAAIALGRARRAPAARQVGLGLALYAAAKALLQASQLGAVGLRVLSYLVVGGFLLGIAYWYRAAGAPRPDDRAQAPSPVT